MDEKEKKALIHLYEKRLDKYGKDVKTVGWRSIPQQLVRFEILSRIADLTNKTLLDVGCGFGDLYNFFRSKNIRLKEYKGIDLSQKMIEEAKRIHFNFKKAKFEVFNLFDGKIDETLKEEYDYVVASGIFSFPIKDNVGYLHEMLRKMYKISCFGVAVNMPISYVDYKDKNLFYFVPEEVFSFCKSITKRVSLLHDYMPYEFTVYLYKDEIIDENHVFKEFRINSSIDSLIK